MGLDITYLPILLERKDFSLGNLVLETRVVACTTLCLAVGLLVSSSSGSSNQMKLKSAHVMFDSVVGGFNFSYIK